MDKKFYAHTRPINENGVERTEYQLLSDHEHGVGTLCRQFAEAFGAQAEGHEAGVHHDDGKATAAFQHRLLDNGPKVDHATAGAQNIMLSNNLLLAACVMGHHSGLPDFGSTKDPLGAPTFTGRIKKWGTPAIPPLDPDYPIPPVRLPQRPVTKPSLSESFRTRMLYSCLVDADYLDTERFMKGDMPRGTGDSLETLLTRLQARLNEWDNPTSELNKLRQQILRACVSAAANPKGIYTLTVPTGGGKTTSSLAFALHHAVEHGMKRVIYVVPYTSIIEQNADVFRGILGNENVLEHHSGVQFENDEENGNPDPKALAAENWDSPLVITTAVQFFESMYANRSSQCRKLHNLANSVIIFDEAQMIPPEHLKPCLAVIEELAAQYGSSVVLCTATQPTFQNFFQRNWEPVELCPCMEEQFRFFKRTRFEDIGTVTEEELEEKLLKETQALCIVNTKKRAQRIYNAIKGDGVFHLSTTMYPKHRKRVLEQIRKRLEDGKKCILIATSLVEAGVDLDFRSVYRQLAGMDSMIQAAGRGNRNGDRSIEESPVYIFGMEGKEFVPGQQMQIDTSKALLLDGYQPEDLATVDQYFQMLYQLKQDEMDKDGVMRCFENQNYQFASAAKKFHLIEENTVTVFVKREQEAAKLLGQIRNQGYSRTLMRQAGQYCINIYDRDFEKLNGQGALRPVSGDIEDFYELVSEELYTEEMGLKMDIEEGIGVFW